MNHEQIQSIAQRIEALETELRVSRAQLVEEQEQRESWARMVSLVTRTRGGTRAFTIVPEEVAEPRNANTHYGYCDFADGKGFHWRGGLYFRRLITGEVVISDWRPILTNEGERKWTGLDVATIDADSWASIVASVSATGETSETYHDAQAFHAGAGRAVPAPQEGPP